MSHHTVVFIRHHRNRRDTTDAQVVIPVGTVHTTRLAFEARIREHQYEQDFVLIDRALENSDELSYMHRSYDAQSRIVEHLGLSHLTPSLHGFIHDHDNMFQAIVRSRQFAVSAWCLRESEPVTWIVRRILYLAKEHSAITIRWSRAPQRIQRTFEKYFRPETQQLCEVILEELVDVLSRIDLRAFDANGDVELENVGADHDIKDFGADIQGELPVDWGPSVNNLISKPDLDQWDHAMRCCICLDIYDSSAHEAFAIAICGHVAGKPCLTAWLNSTSTNANTCPHCRAMLCKRRDRQPETLQNVRVQRYNRLLDLYQELEDFVQVTGLNEETGLPTYLWLGHGLVDLNVELQARGINCRFAISGYRWDLHAMNWPT